MRTTAVKGLRIHRFWNQPPSGRKEGGRLSEKGTFLKRHYGRTEWIEDKLRLHLGKLNFKYLKQLCTRRFRTLNLVLRYKQGPRTEETQEHMIVLQAGLEAQAVLNPG